MAGAIIGTPNSPPTVDQDWDDVISNYIIAGKGQLSISLTNWAIGNTLKPEVASGAALEVNSAFGVFSSNTAIDFSSASSGIVYIYIDVTSTPGTMLPKGTNTVPVWDEDKGGWYLGNNRYTGHYLMWDGATTYTQKSRFLNHQGGLMAIYESGNHAFISTGPIGSADPAILSGSKLFTFTNQVKGIATLSFNSSSDSLNDNHGITLVSTSISTNTVNVSYKYKKPQGKISAPAYIAYYSIFISVNV